MKDIFYILYFIFYFSELLFILFQFICPLFHSFFFFTYWFLNDKLFIIYFSSSFLSLSLSLCSLQCKFCEKHVCTKHRHPDDHACKEKNKHKPVQKRLERVFELAPDKQEGKVFRCCNIIGLKILEDAKVNYSCLKVLNLEHNRITELPKELNLLSSLKVLRLGHNRIRQIPEKLDNLWQLECLCLENNCLADIPTFLLMGMGSLKYLRLYGNNLSGDARMILNSKYAKSHKRIVHDKHWFEFRNPDEFPKVKIARKELPNTLVSPPKHIPIIPENDFDVAEMDSSNHKVRITCAETMRMPEKWEDDTLQECMDKCLKIWGGTKIHMGSQILMDNLFKKNEDLDGAKLLGEVDGWRYLLHGNPPDTVLMIEWVTKIEESDSAQEKYRKFNELFLAVREMNYLYKPVIPEPDDSPCNYFYFHLLLIQSIYNFIIVIYLFIYLFFPV